MFEGSRILEVMIWQNCLQHPTFSKGCITWPGDQWWCLVFVGRGQARMKLVDSVVLASAHWPEMPP